MELIDKSKVVAEIEKRIAEGEKVAKELPSSAIMGLVQAYKNTLSFLDTIEVKETPDSTDLEEEIENELERTWYGEYLDTDKFKESAVYFYKLGLKAQKGE